MPIVTKITYAAAVDILTSKGLVAGKATIVSDLPEGEKTPPVVPSSVMDAKTARQVYGDGSFGGRYRVPDEIMQELFDAALADILQLLKFES